MCGIIGYVGTKPVQSFLIEGLKKLEYRGYDSAGMYIPGTQVLKAKGQIVNLESKLSSPEVGTAGLGHTRWATHGEPTETNAHPHCDSSEKIWLVHNGIIENYQELKARLISAGEDFYSETDSEVLAKLIGSKYKGNLQEAVTEAIKEVVGAYGIAVMHEDNPEEIVLARLGSPVVIAKTDHGVFVSSDPISLITHSNQLVYLEDYEMAVLRPDGFTICDLAGEVKKPIITTLSTKEAEVKKGGFSHFMLKEIFDSPQVVQDTMRGRVLPNSPEIKLGGLTKVEDALRHCSRITIVGCGSAYYAASTGKYLLEKYTQIPVQVELASEYRYKANYHASDEIVLAISQSGETADTLEAVKLAKANGLLTLGIVNTVGSSIARETDAGVYNHAGPEIAVASTKAYISQLVVFVLLTLKLRQLRNLGDETDRDVALDLLNTPEKLSTLLKNLQPAIKSLAKQYAKYDDCIFIGRNTHSPIAAEGALKLKEVSYIHAEAYAGGELKHGPLALMGPEMPVVAIAPRDDLYSKMLGNIEEVKARKSPLLIVTNEVTEAIEGLSADRIVVDKVHDIVQPIFSVLPLHLPAYYIGTDRGIDVDKPRNLAKSVTVE